MSSSVLLQHSEAQRAEILGKYGRTPDSVQQDIENIKNWMEKQPHLPEIPNNQMIERFLICGKFHLEKVKPKLDMYYTIRSLIPEFYDKSPSNCDVKKITDVLYIVPLPKLNRHLERVFIIRLQNHNVDNYDTVAVLSHVLHIAEVRLREECSLSDIYVYDLGGLTLSHLFKFTPTIIKKFVFILEKVIPSKIQGIHFINAPPFMDTLVSLISTYVKPKIAKRVFIHKDVVSLNEIVDRDILPEEYGGQERCLEELQAKWKQKLLEYDAVFAHLHSLKVDESLRIGKPLENDILGIGGNFRQLDVD